MEFDVLIVGAGLAGGSLACALAASRLRVAVLEQRPPSRAADWDSRIYAVSPSNVEFLTALGIWPRLDATRLQGVETMQVFGDAGGKLEFSAYASGLDALAWITEAGPLACELWETLRRQPNVTVLCPAQPRLLQLNADGVRLALEDGRMLSAQLVVGADGADSWVRQAAGLDAQTTPYHELGVVANFSCERPHLQAAYQWFRHDGILAWLPLPGKRFSMVWSCPHAHAQDLLALTPEALCARVTAAGQHALGALQLLTPAQGFPLRLMRVPQVVAPHVALIGDAAHAIHPLSGHGINLGFQDARVLAEVLAALPAHRSCGERSALRRYARARVEEVALTQHVTHGLNRLFRPQNSLFAAFRNAGMSATARLPFVKDVLARYAAGLF